MQFKKIDSVAIFKNCRQKCIDCIGSDIDYIYESLFDDLERVLENFKPKEIFLHILLIMNRGLDIYY